jgi:hypothetical protein
MPSEPCSRFEPLAADRIEAVTRPRESCRDLVSVTTLNRAAAGVDSRSGLYTDEEKTPLGVRPMEQFIECNGVR